MIVAFRDVSLQITRPDTRLPKSGAGGQGPYLRSLDDVGRSSEVQEIKSQKRIKCDRPTNRPTDQQTKRVVESRTSD